MIINAQGNYNQGRGRDGLGFVKPRYTASRFGTSVPASNRPPHISGKHKPAASLDPSQVLPRNVLYRGYSPTGAPDVPGMPMPPPKMSKGLVMPSKPTVQVIEVPGSTFPQQIVAIETPIINKEVIPLGQRIRMMQPIAQRTRPSKGKVIRYRQQFLKWLENWAPQVYADAKRAADVIEAKEATLGQLGGWWETFTDKLTTIGGQYLQFRTQKEILDAQLERMRQGLPPLQTSEYAPTVAVKPDPGTTREITGAIGAGFGSLLPWLAIGGVALFFLMRR